METKSCCFIGHRTIKDNAFNSPFRPFVLASTSIGQEGLENGANIGAAHIDAPRLDLKQNPLYEADNVLLMLGDAKESVAQLQSFL